MRPEDDRTTRLFAALRNRPTPEVDGDAAWRRLRAALPERQASAAPGYGWRAALAGGVALAAVAVLALWNPLGAPADRPGEGGELTPLPGSPDAMARAADGGFVLLSEPATPGPRDRPAEPASSDATVPVAPGDSAPVSDPTTVRYAIEVRLLRAVPAAEAETAMPGAGGADPLGDLRAVLDTVAPDRAYVVDGSWERELVPGVMAGELTSLQGIRFDVDPAVPTALSRVELTGETLRLVAERLDLSAGAPYVFGVREPSGTTGQTLLAIRLRPLTAVGESAEGAPDGPPERR